MLEATSPKRWQHLKNEQNAQQAQTKLLSNYHFHVAEAAKAVIVAIVSAPWMPSLVFALVSAYRAHLCCSAASRPSSSVTSRDSAKSLLFAASRHTCVRGWVYIATCPHIVSNSGFAPTSMSTVSAGMVLGSSVSHLIALSKELRSVIS